MHKCHSSLGLLVYLLVFIIHILFSWILSLTHPCFDFLTLGDTFSLLLVPSPWLSCVYLELSLMLSLSSGLMVST